MFTDEVLKQALEGQISYGYSLEISIQIVADTYQLSELEKVGLMESYVTDPEYFTPVKDQEPLPAIKLVPDCQDGVCPVVK